MLAYFDFLMFELKDVLVDLDNADEQAEAIIVTIAAVDKTVPETFYRLYVDHLDIDKKVLENVLSYYSGIGEIEIVCDCDAEYKSVCEFNNLDRNPWYGHGVSSINKTPEWYASHSRVRDLYMELRG